MLRDLWRTESVRLDVEKYIAVSIRCCGGRHIIDRACSQIENRGSGDGAFVVAAEFIEDLLDCL